ncbi:MAG: choice-of-anchor D domain-containing protein [Myxococcaceae bacterium]|nr:choice-of-anchor D domain-containing protein [Myxococcaceae bacterium]
MRRLVMVGMAAAMACQCPGVVPPDRGTPRLVREVNGVRTPVDEVDFGVVERTTPIEVPLLLENVGPGRLAFERAVSVGGSEVLVNGVGSVAAPFSVTVPDGTLEPGATAPVSVVFRGSANARETGLVHLFFSSSTLDAPLVLTVKAQPASSCTRDAVGTLDFGGVEVGDDARLTVDVVNPTPRTLEVALTDFPVGSAFRPENDVTRLSVAPGATGAFVVRFNPLSEGLFLDEVTLIDACGPTRTKLVGTGLRGVLRANPSPLDFGFSPLALPKEATLTLSNFSAGPVTIRQLTTAPPFGVVNPSAMLVVPGASREPRTSQLQPGTLDVPLRFTPTQLGRVTGQLTMATSLRAQSTLSIPLVGTGGAPAIDVPLLLDLGRVAFFAGQQGLAWALLPVKNVGSQPLEFPAMPTTVSAADRFARGADLCVGESNTGVCQPASFRTLQPGETFDVPISVSPSSLNTAPDGTQSWDVQLRSNDPLRPTVTTRVTVRPVNLPPCQATLSGPLDFGVVSELLPKERAFRFCNVAPQASGQQCLVNRIDVLPSSRDTFSIDAPASDRFLGPGECLSVIVKARQVGLVPAQPRSVSGALRVVSARIPSLTDVLLTATQATSCLVVDPTPLDFGKVTVGCQSVERTVRLHSRCATPVLIDGIALVDDGAAGSAGATFSTVSPPTLVGLPQCQLPGQSAPCLSGGATASLQLRFRPGRVGRSLGALQIRTVEPSGPRTNLLVLHGEGTAQARVADRLPIGVPRAVDVVFIVDGSDSFSLERPAVIRGIRALTDWAVDAGVDARLAVRVMSEQQGPRCPECAPGRFARTDAGESFVTPGAPDLEARFAQLLEVRSTSNSEDVDSEVFETLGAPSVFDPTSSGGVLREQASLGVLTVWDVGLLWPADPPLLPFVSSIKGANRPDLLTLNLVIPGTRASPQDMCGQVSWPPDPLVTATLGAQANLCTAGTGPALASVAPSVFGRRDRVWLRGTPAPAGIASVVLSGAPVPATLWRYDAANNTVVLDQAAIPSTPGSTLDVTYDLACLPP